VVAGYKSNAAALSSPTSPASPFEPAKEPLLPRRLGRYTLIEHLSGRSDPWFVRYLALAADAAGSTPWVVIAEAGERLRGDGRLLAALEAELSRAAGLNHPGLVRIEEVGRQAGSWFVALEHVEGPDLRKLMSRTARLGVPMPAAFALLIVIEVLEALAFAHCFRDQQGNPLGLAHGALSMSDVLLSYDGVVKVGGWGIAGALSGAADQAADILAAGLLLRDLLPAAEWPAGGPRDAERLGHIVAQATTEAGSRYRQSTEMLQHLRQYCAAAGLSATRVGFSRWLVEHFEAETPSDSRHALPGAARKRESGTRLAPAHRPRLHRPSAAPIPLLRKLAGGAEDQPASVDQDDQVESFERSFLEPRAEAEPEAREPIVPPPPQRSSQPDPDHADRISLYDRTIGLPQLGIWAGLAFALVLVALAIVG